MLENYEINSGTLAVIPIDESTSKVIELDNEYIVNKPCFEIIDDSCNYYGSTYQGRYEGTKNMIGMNYKLPIIIEESKNIIFFPTTSPRLINCSWVSLNNLKTYLRNNEGSDIVFKNESIVNFSISIFSLESQILRASRLESILRSRKNQ